MAQRVPAALGELALLTPGLGGTVRFTLWTSAADLYVPSGPPTASTRRVSRFAPPPDRCLTPVHWRPPAPDGSLRESWADASSPLSGPPPYRWL